MCDRQAFFTEQNVTRVLSLVNEKRSILSLFAGCGRLNFGVINNDTYSHVLVNDFHVNSCETYYRIVLRLPQ
jgi:tRNA G37 N-methylase Trm5